jgi:hypothetical protein
MANKARRRKHNNKTEVEKKNKKRKERKKKKEKYFPVTLQTSCGRPGKLLLAQPVFALLAHQRSLQVV